MKKGIRRSQTSREAVIILMEPRSDVFGAAPEGDGGVGGLAGIKKAGMQTMVVWGGNCQLYEF